MSRYELETLPGKQQFSATVGWDVDLQSYFLQVTEGPLGVLRQWHGITPRELPLFADLEALARPWATIPEHISEALILDSGEQDGIGWRRVVFAADCTESPDTFLLICPFCQDCYDECDCPGPTQDDEFVYRECEGRMYARKK